jgi:hypothetical protein
MLLPSDLDAYLTVLGINPENKPIVPLTSIVLIKAL